MGAFPETLHTDMECMDPFFVADLTCRAMKFKIKLQSGSTTNNLDVSLLTVHVKEAV